MSKKAFFNSAVPDEMRAVLNAWKEEFGCASDRQLLDLLVDAFKKRNQAPTASVNSAELEALIAEKEAELEESKARLKELEQRFAAGDTGEQLEVALAQIDELKQDLILMQKVKIELENENAALAERKLKPVLVPMKLTEEQAIITFNPTARNYARKARPFLVKKGVITTTDPTEALNQLVNKSLVEFVKSNVDF